MTDTYGVVAVTLYIIRQLTQHALDGGFLRISQENRSRHIIFYNNLIVFTIRKRKVILTYFQLFNISAFNTCHTSIYCSLLDLCKHISLAVELNGLAQTEYAIRVNLTLSYAIGNILATQNSTCRSVLLHVGYSKGIL